MDSLIGLAGALVGGFLVLIGDIIARRSERRVVRVERMRLAAADIIATHMRARSHLIALKSDGRPLNIDEVWPNDRQLAFSRLYTLPGSERLRPSLLALSDATLQLFEARNESDVQVYFDRQLDAIRNVESEVRELVGR